MFLGLYKILHDDKKDEKLRIDSPIIIQDDKSKVEISKDGKVKIYAENEEKIYTLWRIAQTAIRHASSWMNFNLSKVEIENLETGEKVSPRIYGDLTIGSFRIDHTKCASTIKTLLYTDSEPLQFLTLATDLLARYTEPSSLSALTALELKLNEIIPDDRLQVRQKLAVLRYLNALPPESMVKLERLFTLRNKLAHGNWKGNKIKKALLDLLGGDTSDWFIGPGRLNQDAASRVLEEVISAIGFLSACKTATKNHCTHRGRLPD